MSCRFRGNWVKAEVMPCVPTECEHWHLGNTAACLEGTRKDVHLNPVLFPGDSGQQATMENMFSKSAGLEMLSRCVPSRSLYLLNYSLWLWANTTSAPHLLSSRMQAGCGFFFFNFSPINLAWGFYILIKVAAFINIHQTQMFPGSAGHVPGKKGIDIFPFPGASSQMWIRK